jgi:hypothetical protein
MRVQSSRYCSSDVEAEVHAPFYKKKVDDRVETKPTSGHRSGSNEGGEDRQVALIEQGNDLVC